MYNVCREEDEAARVLLDARLARFKAGEADFERHRAAKAQQPESVARGVGLDPIGDPGSARIGDQPVYSPSPQQQAVGGGGGGGGGRGRARRRQRHRISGARSAPGVSRAGVRISVT